MLQPTYIWRLTEAAEQAASALDTRIKCMIIERIVARLDRGEDFYLTSTDVWNAQVYDDAGGLLEDVAKEIAKYTPLQADLVYKAFQDAMDKSWKYDSAIYKAAGIAEDQLAQSPHYIRLLQRHYEDTINDIYNMTGTRAAAAQKLFIEECTNAYFYIATGAESYSSAVVNAIERAVANVSDKGVLIEWLNADGSVRHVDTLETATLRAVRTGVVQTTAAITNERMNEYGWDLVRVSAHYGARPSHAAWQGGLYSLNGNTPGYATLADATGYGTVTGLCGANCRHSYGPGTPDHNPYERINKGENDKTYEDMQRQRELERRIRKSKGKLLEDRAAIDSAKTESVKEKMKRRYDRQAATLERQNKAYNEFCEETGFKRRQDRLHKGGFTKAEANKASGAARRYNNQKG